MHFTTFVDGDIMGPATTWATLVAYRPSTR